VKRPCGAGWLKEEILQKELIEQKETEKALEKQPTKEENTLLPQAKVIMEEEKLS